MTQPSAYPEVVSREQWLQARLRLLAAERAATHLRDAVNAERRRLPMVRVDRDYVFEGPGGLVRLVDLFEGRTQLYVHHFMWLDEIDQGCPSCTAAADLTFTESDRILLNAKDVTFVCVSRAPLASIDQYRAGHGWTFPWYSTRDGDFSYDYHVTLDPDRAAVQYNYKSYAELRGTAGRTPTCAGTGPAPACSCAAGRRSSTPTPRTPAGSTTPRSAIRSSI